MNKPIRGNQAGFTLIEMLCAVIIIGLLITAISSSVGNFTLKAKLASVKMNCRVVQSVVVGYTTDHTGNVPTSRAQYVSSATFQNLTNPFDTAQQGLGSWNDSLGVSSADNPAPDAPVAIWNLDPALLSLTNTTGVVFYVPYINATDVQTGTLVNIGGDAGSNGYTGYVIEAMGVLQLATPITIPFGDSRISS